MKNKNNRGDIPITILVIGVFVVCTLAILSFFASSISMRSSYVGIDIIEDFNEKIEKGELDNPYKEINKPWGWDYLMRLFKDELLFSVRYGTE